MQRHSVVAGTASSGEIEPYGGEAHGCGRLFVLYSPLATLLGIVQIVGVYLGNVLYGGLYGGVLYLAKESDDLFFGFQLLLPPIVPSDLQ